MTPNELQESVLWHAYVLLDPLINILKVDIIWATKKGSNQTLKKDGRRFKKIA